MKTNPPEIPTTPPRSRPGKKIPLQVNEEGQVIPFILGRQRIPMSYRDLLYKVVFGIGPRYTPCTPCFGKNCAEKFCDYKPKV